MVQTVTRRFGYIKEPRFLSGLFWCYERLDHLQKGYDTSVLCATPADIQPSHLFEEPLWEEDPTQCEFRIFTVPDYDDPTVE